MQLVRAIRVVFKANFNCKLITSKTQPDDLVWMNQLKDLQLSLRFHIQDLSMILDVEPENLHIFVYPSRETKKIWFGGDATDVTDVVTPSIHITLTDWPHATLRHELVHALSSRFAFHGLGFHPNMAFTEGLAMALAPAEDELSLHEGAANILVNQRLTKIENLFSFLFWGEAGARSYTIAGSLLRFLIDQGGITKVKSLYAGQSWEKVFQNSSDSMIAAWQVFLRQEFPQKKQDLAAEALYRYPGIFQDLCPHSKASLAQAAGQLSMDFRQAKGWNPRRDYWPWRDRLEFDPSARVSLFRQKLQNGESQVSREQLLNEIDALWHKPPKTIEDLEYFLLHIDLLILNNEVVKARIELANWLPLLDAFSVGSGLSRQFWVRYLLLEDASSEQAKLWLNYIAGLGKIPKLQNLKSPSWIVAYLYVRNHRWTTADDATWQQLIEVPLPLQLPDIFISEWWKLVGIEQFKQGRFQEAASVLQKAAKQAAAGKREYFNALALEAKFLASTPL